MQYYSTNKQAPDVTLEEAVVKGLAADKGLFMPFTIKPLPQEFYDSIDTLGFQEIAYRVADAFFGRRCSRRYIEADCVRYIELRCPFGESDGKISIPSNCSMALHLPLRM